MQLNDFVYWIDANLPPKAAQWLTDKFEVTATHLYSMGMLSSDDTSIYDAALKSGKTVIIITKDEDFVDIALRKKNFPKIIWITAGNLSNIQLPGLITYIF